MNYCFVYTDTQQWTFDLTPIPGVFYIKKNKASGQVLTVPAGVKDRDFPTLQSKKGGYDPSQLWRFVPSAYGVNLVIQNYSLDGNGLCFIVPVVWAKSSVCGLVATLAARDFA